MHVQVALILRREAYTGGVREEMLQVIGRGVRGVRKTRERPGFAGAGATRSQGREIPPHDRRPWLGRQLQRGSGSSPPSASR